MRIGVAHSVQHGENGEIMIVGTVTKQETFSIDGQALGDMASAVENLRDYLADSGDDEFPHRKIRVAQLRMIAKRLREADHIELTFDLEQPQGGVVFGASADHKD
jgi:hypothetical protein